MWRAKLGNGTLGNWKFEKKKQENEILFSNVPIDRKFSTALSNSPISIYPLAIHFLEGERFRHWKTLT